MSALDRRSFLNVANDHREVASQARTGQQLRTQLCELGLTMLMSAHDFPVWKICCRQELQHLEPLRLASFHGATILRRQIGQCSQWRQKPLPLVWLYLFSFSHSSAVSGRSLGDSHLTCFTPFTCGVICVSVRLKAIEGASVVTVEGKSQLDPLG